MKIAHTRALVARLLTNHSHKIHQQQSEGFCGLQSVSPRNKIPSRLYPISGRSLPLRHVG